MASRPASPATKPITEVAAGAIDLDEVIRQLPEELRAPDGKRWTEGEMESAVLNVMKRIDGKRIQLTGTPFHYQGGPTFDIGGTMSRKPFSAGVEWSIYFEATLRPDSRAFARLAREKKSAVVVGHVHLTDHRVYDETNQVIDLRIYLDDATAE